MKPQADWAGKHVNANSFVWVWKGTFNRKPSACIYWRTSKVILILLLTFTLWRGKSLWKIKGVQRSLESSLVLLNCQGRRGARPAPTSLPRETSPKSVILTVWTLPTSNTAQNKRQTAGDFLSHYVSEEWVSPLSSRKTHKVLSCGVNISLGTINHLEAGVEAPSGQREK